MKISEVKTAKGFKDTFNLYMIEKARLVGDLEMPYIKKYDGPIPAKNATVTRPVCHSGHPTCIPIAPTDIMNALSVFLSALYVFLSAAKESFPTPLLQNRPPVSKSVMYPTSKGGIYGIPARTRPQLQHHPRALH